MISSLQLLGAAALGGGAACTAPECPGSHLGTLCMACDASALEILREILAACSSAFSLPAEVLLLVNVYAYVEPARESVSSVKLCNSPFLTERHPVMKARVMLLQSESRGPPLLADLAQMRISVLQ